MKKQRNTYAKKVILDSINNITSHPSVDDVYDDVVKVHPTISKNTVYRNLRQLATNKTLRRISLPDDSERYDTNTDQHYHFQCERCGKIIDIDIDYLDKVNDTVSQKYHLQVNEHVLVFRGICSQCEESQK